MKVGVGFLILPVLVAVVFGMYTFQPSQSSGTSESFAYHSNVCSTIVRADGTEYTQPCSHNFFTDPGRNLVMDHLGAGPTGLGLVNVIALCNVSTGATGNMTCYGNSTQNANGFGNTTGTFLKVGTGNWSISATFTDATISQTVNGTAILNGTSAGGIVFANNTFTAVTLNPADQITIRWNMSICPSSGC